MKGLYISLDGVDGAGSTTHTKLLAEWLASRGLKAFATKEPTSGRIGSLIRDYLLDEGVHPAVDALLFAADRVEHSVLIRKLLNEGVIVVSDRSIISSLAYQQAQGLELGWLIEINKYSLKPDVPIILDVDPAVSLSRKRSLKEKFERQGFLELVRKHLLDMASKNGWFVVNSSRSIEEVASDIRDYVAKELVRRGVSI
ncbi:MAG: dTMP kinase [Candidatus Verstraetearchaeota archaeon]|nr:dTMP kinase [Candidatus Verstraetearchaeota archaeon]